MRVTMLQNTPVLSCSVKPSFKFGEKPSKVSDFYMNRRRVGALSLVLLLAKDSVLAKLAYGFDFQLVAPDQTIQEAESGIIGHAQALLQVKQLIESESWGQLQTAMRKSSPMLKQDIYTIIQTKPGNQRPLLRKLYSNLFNNVSRLDYAARDGDAERIRQCYDNIVLFLNEFLSLLLVRGPFCCNQGADFIQSTLLPQWSHMSFQCVNSAFLLPSWDFLI